MYWPLRGHVQAQSYTGSLGVIGIHIFVARIWSSLTPNLSAPTVLWDSSDLKGPSVMGGRTVIRSQEWTSPGSLSNFLGNKTNPISIQHCPAPTSTTHPPNHMLWPVLKASQDTVRFRHRYLTWNQSHGGFLLAAVVVFNIYLFGCSRSLVGACELLAAVCGHSLARDQTHTALTAHGLSH